MLPNTIELLSLIGRRFSVWVLSLSYLPCNLFTSTVCTQFNTLVYTRIMLMYIVWLLCSYTLMLYIYRYVCTAYICPISMCIIVLHCLYVHVHAYMCVCLSGGVFFYPLSSESSVIIRQTEATVPAHKIKERLLQQ